MDIQEKVAQFLSSPAFAVVGASSDHSKYGNKVLRCYLQNQKLVTPVNPHENKIEGISAVVDVAHLDDTVESISIITPPKVTEKIVDEAIRKGIRNIWMQPGAESDLAVKKCELHGINVISGGPCFLVLLGFREHLSTHP